MKNREIEIRIPNRPTPATVKDPFFAQLLSYSKIVIFSSHLDDAILSMGGLMSEVSVAGLDIEVCSVFTQGAAGTSKSIEIILGRSGIDNTKDYIKARKKEDETALKSIGVNSFHRMDLLDAAWRVEKDGSSIYPSSQVGIVSELDNPIRNKLEKKIKSYVSEFSNVAFFAPLARGLHIDHQILRDAATDVIPNVIYYVDFPYSAKFENVEEFIQNNKLLKHAWAGDFEKKKEAILLYKTQIESFIAFGNGTLELTPEDFYSKD